MVRYSYTTCTQNKLPFRSIDYLGHFSYFEQSFDFNQYDYEIAVLCKKYVCNGCFGQDLCVPKVCPPSVVDRDQV